MNDSFYTPDRIAEHMVRQVSLARPRIVADFAAGDGALLNAACCSWPGVEAVALDIDDLALRRLRYRNPDWSIGKCNFLSSMSREKSKPLRALEGDAEVILLNPPFSCRGGSKAMVQLSDGVISCSRAMAFVLLATEYLSPTGQIVAILPASTFKSDKDLKAWQFLDKHFTHRKGATAGRGDFNGCFASCTVVVLSRRRRKRSSKKPAVTTAVKIEVSIVRGTAQLHSETGSDRTLVHSTDLNTYSVSLNGRLASKARPSVIGPAILIPRVGQPRIEKVAVYRKRKRVALSDCVIGLQCQSVEDAVWLKDHLVRHKDRFLDLYSGTCAKYTTIARLSKFLRSIGCIAK